MNPQTSAEGPARPRRRLLAWALVGGGLLTFCAANAHLVYVAIRSQPDCVAHARPGQAGGSGTTFSAARSACAPSGR